MSEALIRARKKYEEKRKETMTTVRISKKLRDRWKECAIDNEVTMTDYLEYLLRERHG